MEFKEFDIKKHTTYLTDRIDKDTSKNLMEFFTEIEVEDNIVNNANSMAIASIYPEIDFKPAYPDVTINMDCNGGVVYNGLSMYDTIKTYSNKYNIEIVCKGVVASAAVFVLMSVPLKKRVCTKNTTFLIHQVSTAVLGTTKELEDEAAECKRLTDLTFDIIEHETKITKERLNEVYEKKIDWIITAEEALELGIVGKII